MDKALRAAVDGYIGANRARFHMPGHKGRWGLTDDITEVEGCDSLYEAAGPIRALEREMSRVYGSGGSLLCAGGATLCIQTMLGLCGPGAKIIAGRGLHRSAVNAMILLGQEPVWVYPEDGGWFRGAYRSADVRAALEQHRDAAAVYLTSPDYYGGMSNLREMAAVCRDFHKPLLVDNAHGAHLKFFTGLHPMDQGASMCADSLHKTLPAMTGGAALHLEDGGLVEEARRVMALFGSTSPSYPIMLSCEAALDWAETHGALFAQTAERFAALGALARENGFLLPSGERDPAKLTLGFGQGGIPDAEFGAYVREMGVEPEYVGGGVCVLMGNPLNGPEDFTRIERMVAWRVLTEKRQPPGPPPHLEKAMPLREAAFSAGVETPVEEAAGRVAAAETSPCPPGIPVVMCGERVDGPMTAYLKALGIRTLRVIPEAK